MKTEKTFKLQGAGFDDICKFVIIEAQKQIDKNNFEHGLCLANFCAKENEFLNGMFAAIKESEKAVIKDCKVFEIHDPVSDFLFCTLYFVDIKDKAITFFLEKFVLNLMILESSILSCYFDSKIFDGFRSFYTEKMIKNN